MIFNFPYKKEKESALESAFSPSSPSLFTRLRKGELLVDVYEDKGKIVIQALVPGINKEDIDIFLKEDIITISGKRRPKKRIKEERYFIRECPQGGFSRSIILPFLVDRRSLETSLKEGILTITLVKLKNP